MEQRGDSDRGLVCGDIGFGSGQAIVVRVEAVYIVLEDSTPRRTRRRKTETFSFFRREGQAGLPPRRT